MNVDHLAAGTSPAAACASNCGSSIHDWIGSGADIVSALAGLAVAITAVWALFLAKKQIATAKEISAIEAYEDYHRLCIDYPEFSDGADFRSLEERDLDRYLSFVLYVLMVGERIYKLFPNDEVWREAILDDLRIHQDFISSEKFERYFAQGWATEPLIQQVILENRAEARDQADAEDSVGEDAS